MIEESGGVWLTNSYISEVHGNRYAKFCFGRLVISRLI